MDFKGRHFESTIILMSIRWYCSYSLSYRNIEELMLERGVSVDHTTLNRWVVKYSPELEKKFMKYKRPSGDSWRMDETYIKVKGQWKYLYRAVDKTGNTIDFLLTAKRDKKAALRFFKKAIGNNGTPRVINIDKSGANTAGIELYNDKHDVNIIIRQCKYLNNIVESDHRRIKRIVKPMMGFKSFKIAKNTLAGIELMAMLRKNQQDFSAQNSIESFWKLALA